MRRAIWAAVCVSLLGVFSSSAPATYHFFRINEIYSNPSGSVQFIEMREVFGSDFQQFVTQAPDIKSTTHDFFFPNDLPSFMTANKTGYGVGEEQIIVHLPNGTTHSLSELVEGVLGAWMGFFKRHGLPGA